MNGTFGFRAFSYFPYCFLQPPNPVGLPPEISSAPLEQATGVGLLRRSGERPQRLAAGLEVAAGDELRTLEGTAELAFTDGALLSLEAFSRFTIGEESGSEESTPLTARFELGESRFRSGARPGRISHLPHRGNRHTWHIL